MQDHFFRFPFQYRITANTTTRGVSWMEGMTMAGWTVAKPGEKSLRDAGLLLKPKLMSVIIPRWLAGELRGNWTCVLHSLSAGWQCYTLSQDQLHLHYSLKNVCQLTLYTLDLTIHSWCTRLMYKWLLMPLVSRKALDVRYESFTIPYNSIFERWDLWTINPLAPSSLSFYSSS